jgi:hypothetical protein
MTSTHVDLLAPTMMRRNAVCTLYRHETSRNSPCHIRPCIQALHMYGKGGHICISRAARVGLRLSKTTSSLVASQQKAPLAVPYLHPESPRFLGLHSTAQHSTAQHAINLS